MTVDGTGRPTGGRRDDDFFAVERVGEPDDTAVSRPAPATDGGWDVTPWPSSGLDVSAGSDPARGVMGGPLVDGPVLGGPVVGGPTVSGPTVGGGASAGDDPFDVSSTWNGPAPVIGGPSADLGRAAPEIQPGPRSPGPGSPASHPQGPHTPVPPAAAPQAGLPPVGPSVTGSFRVPSRYESGPPAPARSYVEPTPPPRFPTERGSAPPGRVGGPDTGSVRIGGPDTGPAPGWGPVGPGAGPPGINPGTGSFPLPPARSEPPAARPGTPGPSAYQGYDAARPQSTPPPPSSPPPGVGHPGGPGLPRPDQTGGFPRPDQTGGFARPGAAYPNRPGELERPAPRPVDPWNGHSTGSGPRPDLSLPPRGGTPPADRGPDDRRDGYDSQARGGYEVRPDQSRGERGPARAPDGYGARGPTTGGYRVGGGAAPLGGTGSPGADSPGGAASPGGTVVPGGGPSMDAAAPGRPVGVGPGARAALPPGSWSGPPGGDASGPWRSPHRDDPAAFSNGRPRGAELPPLVNDPLSGPLPVATPPPGRPELGRPGGRPEPGRAEPGRPEPGGRGGPAGTTHAEPLAPGQGTGTGPSGPWRSPPPRAAVEDTMTTTRSPFRGSGALPALPPGRSAAPGAPGTTGADQMPPGTPPPPAPGAGTGPRAATGPRGATGPRALPGPAAAGAAPGRARRPESPAEMTSLVTRRGRAGAAGAADRGDDSGWQPSRGTRRTGARGVPADRRRTPNPTTDTNSLQAVSAPPARRTTPRPADAPEDTGSTTGRSRSTRADRPGRGGPDVDDLHVENRRSAARGAGLGGAGGARGGGAGGGGAGRDGAGRDSAGRDGAGGRGGRGRGAGDDRPSTRAVGVLEPAEVEDEADDQPSTPDRLAWLKEGWIGPLAIALVVSLFVVGAYTLLAGGDGGDQTPTEPTATQSEPPVPTNPEALAGKALVNGTWHCRVMVDGGTTGDLLPDKLVVDPTGLTYRWNDGQGAYTVTPKQSEAGASLISEIQFTSGPLQGVTGKSLITTKENSGFATGTLLLDAMPNVPTRGCFVN